MLASMTGEMGYEGSATPMTGPKHLEIESKSMPGVMLDEHVIAMIDFLVGCGVVTLYSCQGEAGLSP
jgi:hypothetical protein